jgi:hypothetical protein
MGIPGCGTQPRAAASRSSRVCAGRVTMSQTRMPGDQDRERVAGPHAQRGGVYHHVMTGRIGQPNGYGHRGISGGNVRGEPVRPGRCSVRDGQAGRARSGHGECERAPGTARARQQHPLSGKLVAGLTQPDGKTRPVGVGRHEPPAGFPAHHVDRADQRGLSGQLIDVRGQCLLVRHGRAEPGQVAPPAQAARETTQVAGSHVRGHRHRVDAPAGELGVHDLRRARMGAWVRQVQVHPGGAGDSGAHRWCAARWAPSTS